MNKLIIKNARVVNEGIIEDLELLICGARIERIGTTIEDKNAEIFDADGLFLIPGCIDDQVHFREPGLTHKGDIYHESQAAVAGGVTSFMEMPNTQPLTLKAALLEEKYKRAAEHSFANYSFYMGTSNDNLDEILGVNYDKVCGIKVFMGSSTGDMLVDSPTVLDNLFRNAPVLISTHCEDEGTIRQNTALFSSKYGDQILPEFHPEIRSREACYKSSSLAIELAKKHNTRLHILHISTADELELFTSSIPLEHKRITSEACVHHMYFNDEDYKELGHLIKCNPAIKKQEDAEAIAKALIEGRIDVVATDHAPHTMDEKRRPYLQAPSGLPLVQHPLSLMVTMAESYGWDLPFIVEKMAHNPAICFQVKERGFIREGYFADLVLLDPNSEYLVQEKDLLYKCGWSPLTGRTLKGKIKRTFVNGQVVYDGAKTYQRSAMRLEFSRG